MLLRMGLLLRLGPNVITDGTFITLGSNYYTCAFYMEAPFDGLLFSAALMHHENKISEGSIIL